MPINRAVVKVTSPLVDEKYLGLSLGERIILSLLYGGIRDIIVDESFNIEALQKRHFNFSYSLVQEKNPIIDKQTLVVDTLVVINSAFIHSLLQKNLSDSFYISSFKGDLDFGEVFIPITNPEDLKTAKPMILKSLGKKRDTLLAFLFNRKISTRITAFLSPFKWISPNLISLICLFMGIYAMGLLFIKTSYITALAAGIMMYLASLLDGVDGELARVTYRYSQFGLWLDNITDELLNFLMIGSTCIYSYHITQNKLYLYFCLWGMSLFIAGKVLQYIVVFFKMQPEDISQYKLPVFNKNNKFNKVAAFLVKYLQHIPRADMMKFMLMIMALFASLPIYAYGVFIFSEVFFIGVVISTVQIIKKVYFKS